MQFSKLGSIGPALLFTIAFSSPSRAQATQATLAEQVLSGNYVVSSHAVAATTNLEPAEIGQDLRTVLFAALTREASIHTKRFEAGRRNEILQPFDNAEHVLALARAVIRLRDPASIPSLTAALFTGSSVPNAIAQFGEQAIPAVLQVVMDDNGWYDAISGGLIALRFIVEGQQQQALSVASINQIRDATMRILTGRPYFPVLWRAIDLAAVLGDAGLRRILSTLASDPGAVAARGLADPDLIDRTRQRARDRLAGIPPLPRPGNSEDQ